jgi:DNA invertase Pin-like site-specific DNA recombinase
MDELNALGIEFISAREAIDTSGPMGRMFVTMLGSIAELERSLIVERIKAGMRRARFEGQRLGRAPLNIDHEALVRDRLAGMSLTSVSKKYGISRASVVPTIAPSRQPLSADSSDRAICSSGLRHEMRPMTFLDHGAFIVT